MKDSVVSVGRVAPAGCPCNITVGIRQVVQGGLGAKFHREAEEFRHPNGLLEMLDIQPLWAGPPLDPALDVDLKGRWRARCRLDWMLRPDRDVAGICLGEDTYGLVSVRSLAAGQRNTVERASADRT